jgi:hypothetical protein
MPYWILACGRLWKSDPLRKVVLRGYVRFIQCLCWFQRYYERDKGVRRAGVAGIWMFGYNNQGKLKALEALARW